MVNAIRSARSAKDMGNAVDLSRSVSSPVEKEHKAARHKPNMPHAIIHISRRDAMLCTDRNRSKASSDNASLASIDSTSFSIRLQKLINSVNIAISARANPVIASIDIASLSRVAAHEVAETRLNIAIIMRT